MKNSIVGLTVLSLLLSVACNEDADQGTVDIPPQRSVLDPMDGTGGQSGDGELNDLGDAQTGTRPADMQAPTYQKRVIDDRAGGPAFAEIADMNGDGRLDIVVSKLGGLSGNSVEPGSISIYFQGENLEEWSKQEVTTPEQPIYWPNALESHDIDGDGDLDLTVGAGFLICEILGRTSPEGQLLPPGPCGGLFWYEQTTNGWIQHEVVGAGSDLFYHTGLLADLDNDGIVDMVTVGERMSFDTDNGGTDRAETQWFKGTATSERFEAIPRVVGPGMGSLPALHDVDSDGDVDILSAEYFTASGPVSFAWYEQVMPPNNQTPSGLWQRHVIDNRVGPAIQLSIVPNLYGDGVFHAVGTNHTQTTGDAAEPWESAVYVYSRSEDPTAQWTRRQISQNIVSRPRANMAAPGIFDYGDVDGDGDVDLLVSGDGDSRVFLLLQDEQKNFATWVFDEGCPQAGSTKISDLDGDGIAEILVSSFDNDALYLYHSDADGPHPLRLAERPDWATDNGVRLRVNYTGEATGQLVVGLFTEWPPSAPPEAFKVFDTVRFPLETEFENVAVGPYVALAFIDVDGSGITGPTDTDIQARVNVTSPTNGPVDINLSDNGTMQPSPNDGTTLEVRYTGLEAGPLVVALFSSWPPSGPPSFFEQVANPSFPQSVQIPDLPAGDYVALAFIDVDGSGVMSPSEGDVQAQLDLTLPTDVRPILDLGSGAPANVETVSTEIIRDGRRTPLTAYLPMLQNPRPLLVFTPGFQLESDAYAGLCEGLAAQGFIVARLDPPGSLFDVDHIAMGADIRAGIDWLVNDSEFAARIDANRIGTFGHSLGGKLAIMNAIEDPRIQAVLAIDPVDGDPSPLPNPQTRPALVPGPVAEISVPMGLIGETTNGVSNNAFAPACAPLDANFQTFFEAAVASPWVVEWEIIGADHMDFVEECPPGAFSPCSVCPDGALEKARVLEITADLTSAFFRFHFNNEQAMLDRLTGAGLAPEVRLRER